MGSIEMTDYERRQFAAQSLESNVRDENFCELFPELTMVIIANMPLGLVLQALVLKYTLLKYIHTSPLSVFCLSFEIIYSNNVN